MINKFKVLIDMARITYSPKYAMKKANEYWQNTTITHTSMEQKDFERYYFELIKIMLPNRSDKILDYGGGNGEITSLFKKDNFNIAHCDISVDMVHNAQKRYSLESCECNKIKLKKYNKILFHNAFFYVHPKLMKETLDVLYDLLEENGKLYITDTPDFDKRDYLGLGKLYMLVTRFFPVYQVRLSGFFVKNEMLVKISNEIGFSINKLDSWGNYRSHWILTKVTSYDK